MFKYGSSGRLQEKSELYKNVESFLVDNPLIRDGVQFDLEVENLPHLKGTYELRGATTLVNIATGQEQPANIAVFNNRNLVKVKLASEIEVRSISRINKQAGKNVLSHMSRGIHREVVSADITPQEVADIASEVSKVSERKGKLFREALISQAQHTSRKIAHSLDFEAHLDSEGSKISFENIYSAGFAETTEDLYTMKGDSKFVGGFSGVKTYKDKAVNYFDIVKSMQMVGSHSDGNVYGKQNTALLFDHIRGFISGDTKAPDWMDAEVFEKSRAQVISQLGPVGEKIKKFQSLSSEMLLDRVAREKYVQEFQDLFADGITDPYRKKEEGSKRLVSFLGTIQERTDAYRNKALNNLKDGQSTHMVFGEFSLGVMKRPLDSKRGGRNYYEEIRFTNNMLGSVVGRMNNSQVKEFSTYGNAENGAITSKRLELERELIAMEARSASPKEINNIKAAIAELHKVQPKITDMKSRTEMLFDRLLPDIKRNLSDSSVGATRALEKIVPASIMEKIHQSGTLSFIGDRGKGLSVENLYQIVSGSDAKEFHTGGMDASDLNHIRLFLEETLSSGDKYKSTTTRRMPGTKLGGVTKSQYEMIDLSSTVARKIQQKVLTIAVLKQSSDEQLVKMLSDYAPSSAASKNLNTRFSGISLLTDENEKVKQSTILRGEMGENLERIITAQMDKDFNSTSKQYKAHMRNLNKYSTDNPGLLAKSLSRPGMARVAAMASFLWLTRTNAEDDPGASIERGEHNSMETVARRIATTPFNSAISLGGIRFPWALLSRFKNSRIASVGKLFDQLKDNSFSKFKDYEIQEIQKRALLPAFKSSEARLAKVAGSFDSTYVGTDVISSRSQRLIADRMMRNTTSIPSINKTLRESVNTERLRNWDNLKADSFFTVSESPRYMTPNGFFLGNTGPHTKSSSLGLSFERPGREVFVDQSRVLDFMKSHKGIDMADNAFMEVSKNQKSTLVRPSFDVHWTGRNSTSDKMISNAAIPQPKFLPYNQEVPTPKIDFDQDTSNLSSTILGLKSKKYNRHIEFNKSDVNSKSYYDYDNTLMNVKTNKQDLTSAGRSLRNSNIDRNRTTTSFVFNKSKIDTTSSPVIVRSNKTAQPMAPIHHKDKAFSTAAMPIVRQPKRLDPNDYINDANMMLTAKGGFQTAGNYPATSGQVMGYMNNLATRY